MNARLDSIADRLDLIAQDIADMAIAELRTAVRRGDQKRPTSERTLTQARRAVDKAAHLLRSLEHDGADNDQ